MERYQVRGNLQVPERLCLWATSGLLIIAAMAVAEPPPEMEIGYVRPAIPPVVLPSFKGVLYPDRVPDTLDISEMARLALGGLTGPTDPKSGYELYFLADFFRKPPVLIHDFGDPNQSKFMGPLQLCRIVTGSTDHLGAEFGMIASYLKSIGPDRLYYTPVRGKPWLNAGAWDEIKGQIIEDKNAPAYAGPRTLPHRLIEAMLLYYLRTGDSFYKEVVTADIDLRTRIMMDKGDWGYFGPPDQVPTGFLGADGWTIQSMAQAYRVLGDKRALDIARKLVVYQRRHAETFEPDGRFIFEKEFQPQRGGAHFHVHTNLLLGFIEYARAAGDKEVLEFVRKSYEWARSEQAYSCPLVGFFPENVKPDAGNTELCAVADMVALALMLTDAGAGDYWDDADRWIRNQFAEGQLTSADWIYRMAKTMPEKPVEYNQTADHAAERSIGAFSGWPGANEWTVKVGIQHCCTANAARTLYYIWQDILSFTDGALKVNLLLNRASAWADVISYVPYQGRIDIRVKANCRRVLIRAPEWIQSGSAEVSCRVDGAQQSIAWDGRYMCVNDVHKGSAMTIEFPIATKTVSQKIGAANYALTIKGNTVIAIDPPGTRCPLYCRERYAGDTPHWIDVVRFVSEEIIRW